jgi:hypothetical protein
MIVSTPAAPPVTAPLAITVAIPGLTLVHVPPVVASANVEEAPIHIFIPPDIAAGAALTLIILVTVHPVPSEYVIVAVPGLTPLTTPLSDPTFATAVLSLLHTPPPTASVIVVVSFAHTAASPKIAVGERLIVTVVCALQPATDV